MEFEIDGLDHWRIYASISLNELTHIQVHEIIYIQTEGLVSIPEKHKTDWCTVIIETPLALSRKIPPPYKLKSKKTITLLMIFYIFLPAMFVGDRVRIILT